MSEDGEMNEVVLLGTGTPMVDPLRCGSGTAIVGPTSWLLVDCGRGVTQRVMQAGLDLLTLDAVVLTHHHSDHVSDLATLAISRWTDGATTPLLVLSPDGPCHRYASQCLDAFDDQAFYSQAPAEASPRPSIESRAFFPAPSPEVVLDVGPWKVTSALVDHHPIEAAVGYRIEDGLSSVVVSGDTAVCPGIGLLAKEADLLIHEALDADKVSSGLLEWNASAESVGALARSAGVKRLVLTHLLPPPTNEEEGQRFVRQARTGGFDGSIEVAADLNRLAIP